MNFCRRLDSVRLPEQPIEDSVAADTRYAMTSSASQQGRFAQDSYEDNNFDVDDGFERNDVTTQQQVRTR